MILLKLLDLLNSFLKKSRIKEQKKKFPKNASALSVASVILL
jgi:hypothetical protein